MEKQVAKKKWRAEALRLAEYGYSYAEIGRQLGKKTSTVAAAVKSELAKVTTDTAADLKAKRAIVVAQYDKIVKAFLKEAEAGDKQAAAIVISANKEKAKTGDLNPAERHELSGKLELSFDVHQELLDRLTKHTTIDGEPASEAPAPEVDGADQEPKQG